MSPEEWSLVGITGVVGLVGVVTTGLIVTGRVLFKWQFERMLDTILKAIEERTRRSEGMEEPPSDENDGGSS